MANHRPHNLVSSFIFLSRLPQNSTVLLSISVPDLSFRRLPPAPPVFFIAGRSIIKGNVLPYVIDSGEVPSHLIPLICNSIKRIPFAGDFSIAIGSN